MEVGPISAISLDKKRVEGEVLERVITTLTDRVLKDCTATILDTVAILLIPRMHAVARKIASEPQVHRRLTAFITNQFVAHCSANTKLDELLQAEADKMITEAFGRFREAAVADLVERLQVALKTPK